MSFLDLFSHIECHRSRRRHHLLHHHHHHRRHHRHHHHRRHRELMNIVHNKQTNSSPSHTRYERDLYSSLIPIQLSHAGKQAK